MKRRILFRADAHPSIGIGDLASLIYLSQYLDESWETYFIIRNYPAGMSLVNNHVHKNVHIIDQHTTIPEEVSLINNFIQLHHIDAIFFEITEIPLSEYKGIDRSVKKACVTFDGKFLNSMDLVVCWDVKAREIIDTAGYPQTTFLLGPEYVILPPHFYSAQVNTRTYTRPPQNVLITMGGADEFNVTQKVVEQLSCHPIQSIVNIVTGPGYQFLDSLNNILIASSLSYTHSCNVNDMLPLYLKSDVAIGAGGLTSSELVATRTPALLIATYPHQIPRCRYFDNQGWVKYLGYKDFSSSELIYYIMNPPEPSNAGVFKTSVIIEVLHELIT